MIMLNFLRNTYKPFIFVDLTASIMNILNLLITPQDDIAFTAIVQKSIIAIVNPLTGKNYILPLWVSIVSTFIAYFGTFAALIFILYLMDKQMFNYIILYIKIKLRMII